VKVNYQLEQKIHLSAAGCKIEMAGTRLLIRRVSYWLWRDILDLLETIYSRRSVREFKDGDTPEGQVPDSKVELILDTARYAPSFENVQGWRFIVVRDKEMREMLSESAKKIAQNLFATSYDLTEQRLYYLPKEDRPGVIRRLADGSLFDYNRIAPVNLICCYAKAHHDLSLGLGWGFDEGWGGYSLTGLSMAAQNMWLTATNMGLGMAWSGMPVLDLRNRSVLKEALGIPPGWETGFVLAIGVPKRDRHLAPPRFPLEAIAFNERWGRPYRRLGIR